MKRLLIGLVFLIGACASTHHELKAKPPNMELRAFERVPEAHGTRPAAGDVRVALREIERANLQFATDSYEVGPRARERLASAARILAPHSDVEIVIVGHSDERGHEKYNRGLGYRRANAVAATLALSGIDWGRLVVVSAGEEQPAPSGHDDEAWAANRFVRIQLREAGRRMVARPPARG